MKSLPFILAAITALGCGGSATGPRPIPPPPDNGPPEALQVEAPFFVPGEFFEWELSWKGIAGGKTRMIVGAAGEVGGVRAINVRSETRSDGLLAMFRHVRDDLITTVALDGGLPIESHGTFEFGKRQKKIKRTKVDATFDGQSYHVVYARKGRPTREWTQRLPEGEIAYDVHSVLGAVRAWDPEDGTRTYLYALSGRRLYRVELAAAGREPVKIGLGQFPARRIEGVGTRLRRSLAVNQKRKPRHFTLWISDDGNNLPLLIKARTEHGDVQVELVDYQGGPVPVAQR